MNYNNNPNYINKIINQITNIGFTSSEEGINIVKDAFEGNPYYKYFYNRETKELTVIFRYRKNKERRKLKLKTIAPLFLIWTPTIT